VLTPDLNVLAFVFRHYNLAIIMTAVLELWLSCSYTWQVFTINTIKQFWLSWE